MRYSGFYYSLFKGTMKRVIARSYGNDYANKIMKSSKTIYKKIVKAAPDMGNGNPMAYNALFAYAFLSPYLASNRMLKKEVVASMMEESLYHVKWYFKATNLNTPKGKLKSSKSVRKYYKWYTPEREKKYPESFKVDFDGIPYEGASYYRITKCPICSYARALGCEDLMPMLCELDRVMIKLQHGVLHRDKTIARGDEYCDYFILGDKEDIKDLKNTSNTEAPLEDEVLDNIENEEANQDENALNDIEDEEGNALDNIE